MTMMRWLLRLCWVSRRSEDEAVAGDRGERQWQLKVLVDGQECESEVRDELGC